MMKITALTLAATMLATAAMAQADSANTGDEERVLDEVETTETKRSSGRDRNRGAGEEIAANADRSWREQITCKTRRVTGSRIARERTCRTNAQWEAQQQENQRALRNTTMGQSGSNQ
ncbi:MAG: hypothetical protein AAGJ32_12135 [Pseudomonadota bacterium]